MGVSDNGLGGVEYPPEFSIESALRGSHLLDVIEVDCITYGSCATSVRSSVILIRDPDPAESSVFYESGSFQGFLLRRVTVDVDVRVN